MSNAAAGVNTGVAWRKHGSFCPPGIVLHFDTCGECGWSSHPGYEEEEVEA